MKVFVWNHHDFVNLFSFIALEFFGMLEDELYYTYPSLKQFFMRIGSKAMNIEM
jgi:hypothetical protein